MGGGGWGRGAGSIETKTISASKLKLKLTEAELGNNTGMYTTVMAAAGCQVVAVDAMLANLAYIHHSLIMGNTTQYVRLLNYPVR